MTLRIDAHQHFWRLSRGDYAWLNGDEPALQPLRRDFLPEHLVPILRDCGVQQTVLVQATDTAEETDYLLGLADQHDFIGAVIGWVDLSRAEAVQQIERLSRHPKFKGVRPMLQDMPQDDWLFNAAHPAAMEALTALGLCLDALVKPQHLESLISAVRRWPGLKVVIDHAAKPELREDWKGAEAWRRQLAELATSPQLHCKISGLMTQGPEVGAAEIAEVWDSILQSFGPERLMWGSDWPVLTLACDYSAWIQHCAALIDTLSEGDRAQVWHGTAQRFYGLKTA